MTLHSIRIAVAATSLCLVTIPFSPSFAQDDGSKLTAGEVAEWCRSITDHNDAESQGAAFCEGAFTSLASVSRMVNVDTFKPLLGMCVPDDLDAITAASVFVRFVKNHPSARGDRFVPEAMAALQEAYPCPQ